MKVKELFESTDLTLDQLADFYVKNCSDYNVNKPFIRSSTKSESGLFETRVRKEIRGRAGPFWNYFFATPKWSYLPDRKKSIFCGTDEKDIQVSKININIIVPLNTTKLALLDSVDFNFIKIKAGYSQFIGLFTETLCNLYDTLPKDEAFKKAMDMLVTFSKMSELVIDKEFISAFSNKHNIAFVEAKDLLSILPKINDLFDPKTLGINTFYLSNIKYNPNSSQEVWFEGKYLSITEDDYPTFCKLIKEKQK